MDRFNLEQIRSEELRKRAKNVNSWLDIVMPYMDTISIPNKMIPEEKRLSLRAVFNNQARLSFLMWLNKNYLEDVTYLNIKIDKEKHANRYRAASGLIVEKQSSADTSLFQNFSPPEDLMKTAKTSPVIIATHANISVKKIEAEGIPHTPPLPIAAKTSIVDTNNISIAVGKSVPSYEGEIIKELTQNSGVTTKPPSPNIISAPSKWKSCNVDHIVPLGNGGTNKARNLCIVPIWVNLLKHEHTRLQRTLDRRRPKITVLVPKKDEDGKYLPVPRFPDSFYRKTFPELP